MKMTMNPKKQNQCRPSRRSVFRKPAELSGPATGFPPRAMIETKRLILKKLVLRINKEHCLPA